MNIDVAVVFRIMGDKERDEDPQNVYKFVHYVTAKGIEQQLKSAQVRVLYQTSMGRHELWNQFSHQSAFFFSPYTLPLLH